MYASLNKEITLEASNVGVGAWIKSPPELIFKEPTASTSPILAVITVFPPPITETTPVSLTVIQPGQMN